MARWTFTRFAASQWTPTAPATKADLAGKVVVIVGASSGIGLEAAKHFAGMNPKKLVLACRNEERANRALSGKSAPSQLLGSQSGSTSVTDKVPIDLKESTGYERAEIQMVDLARFTSVIDFAKNFNDREDRLDILVQNAGVLPEREYTATEDGWETTLQVNHVALSLLGILLLPKVISTAERFSTHPGMIFVGSEVHLLSKFEISLVEGDHPFKTFGSKEYCTPEILQKRYNDTKLMNLLFVRAFSDRLPSPSPVIITCINPGFCYSDLRNKPNNMQVTSGAFDEFVNWAREKVFARTAEEGSRQILFAALSGSGDGAPEEAGNPAKGGMMSMDKLRGAYVSNCEVAEPSDYVLGEEGREAQERLWVDLIKELTLVEPQVQEITTRYLTDPVNLE